MRLHLLIAAIALSISSQTEARIVYRPVVTPPPANVATDAEYDHAKIRARIHGSWPDDGAHAGWSRGARLPLSNMAYAAPIDWRAAKLYQPDAGARWTRIGDDYILFSTRTRQIQAVVLAPVATKPAAAPAAAKKKPYVTTLRVKAKPRR
jgi:Ni/Co efflux regulator RcnB